MVGGPGMTYGLGQRWGGWRGRWLGDPGTTPGTGLAKGRLDKKSGHIIAFPGDQRGQAWRSR